jgi:hypothetical protein
MPAITRDNTPPVDHLAGPIGRRTLALGGAVACVLALATPAAGRASTVFDGRFESGSLAPWSLRQLCAPDRAQIYSTASQPSWPAPVQGRDALRLLVLESDVAPCTPTSDPRAQIGTGKILAEGQEYWESFAVLFPPSFPAPRAGAFYVFQQDYSEPWNGSPALGFGAEPVDGADALTLRRGAAAGYDRIWSAPLVRGVWNRFLVHKRFARDGTGFIELWLGGVKQTFVDGSQKLSTATMHADQIGAGRFFLDSYRRAGAYPGAVESFFDDARIGTSRSDVISSGG